MLYPSRYRVFERGKLGGTMSTDNDHSVEEILDMIGDPRAREILIAVSHEPRSANELADELGYAPSTVYGRLDDLESYKLVTSEMKISRDGNHYQEFQCNFESTLISIDDDEYDVRIFRKDNLPDRFSQLWDELRGD